MKPLIWIIDEEWAEYELEQQILNERYPGCTIKFSGYDYQADLVEFGKDADAILCQIYTYIPKQTIKQLNCCKAIAVYGGGYDRIDIAAAREKGIKVTNVSNYCKEDLADYTIAAIYGFYKELSMLTTNVKALPWGAQAIVRPPVRLSQCILHIIGLGRIGKEVARKAIANDLKVTAYDPYVSADMMSKYGVQKVEWKEGLSYADFVSVNCILIDETIDLLKYEDFLLMKPTAFLINTARGKIIEEAGMCKAITEGLIKGAMVDVIQNEPPTYQEEIFGCSNIHVTPHVSYISIQSYEELKRRATNNAIMGIEGQISPDLVNS